METENQTLSIHRQTSNLSPVTEIGSVTTKNKRKNFNPRFTSATDEFEQETERNANSNPLTTELTVKIEKGKYSSEDEASGSEEGLSHHNRVAQQMSQLNEKDVAERLARFPSAEENLANAIESTRVKTMKDIQSPDQEAKYRDFAFKTMQELLNIYGLSLTFNDMVDAFKQQKLQMESKFKTFFVAVSYELSKRPFFLNFYSYNTQQTSNNFTKVERIHFLTHNPLYY